MKFALLSLIVAASFLVFSSPTRADEFGDFQEARDAYDLGDFALAQARFEALVGGETPQLRTPTLISESRKYLAASYLFLSDRARAEEQLVLLVRGDPNADVDPLVFPREVAALFRSIRGPVIEQMRAQEIESARDAEERRVRATEDAERAAERLRQLERLASEEVVRTEHSRFVATIPFGVGQFQNGHSSLGVFLLASESTLLAANIVTYLVQLSLPRRDSLGRLPGGLDDDRLSQTEAALSIANYATLGVFLAVTLVGLIDAHVRFIPVQEERRARELPEELRTSTVDVSFSGSGFVVRW
jgi:hypothetical protein